MHAHAMRQFLAVSSTVAVLLVFATGAAAEPASQLQTVPDAKGWVILAHASGWHIVGEGMLGFEYANAERLHRWGWSTLNVDYRKGARGLKDLVRFHDELRSRIGGGKLCVLGTSSGGHLALLLARRRPDIDCIITEAAPTYLPGLDGEVGRLARRFFGPYKRMRRWSPALRPPRMPILLSQATNDKAVAFEQSTLMLHAAPHARRIALHPGKAEWVHASVRRRDLKRLYRAEHAFLNAVR